MNKLTNDLIVIDTNIFEHLLNPKENKDKHITKLLSQLIRDKVKLLVDKQGRIEKEYQQRLLDIISPKNKRQIDYRRKEKPLLSHWLQIWLKIKNQCQIEVDQKDNLMQSIRGIVPKQKKVTDNFFVYLALIKGRILITNDRAHFIDEGKKTDKRRKKLLNIQASKFKKKGANILTSEEAYGSL